MHAAFIQSSQSSLTLSPNQAQRALSPFDSAPVLVDTEHPYRHAPTRQTRTTRQGPHWVLWRETASPLLPDDLTKIDPLVHPESASAGDVYELRYTADEKTFWVRQESSCWLGVCPGAHHPLIAEYVLHLRDDATGPSWIKLETKKKYEREIEKARVN